MSMIFCGLFVAIFYLKTLRMMKCALRGSLKWTYVISAAFIKWTLHISPVGIYLVVLFEEEKKKSFG